MPGVTVFPTAPTGLPGLGSGSSSKWTAPPSRESVQTTPATTSAPRNSAPKEDAYVTNIRTSARDIVQREAKGASSLTLLKSARSQNKTAHDLESRGEIQEALSCYSKVAALAKMVMDSAEFAAESRSGKGGVLRQQLTEFLENEAGDLGSRINILEEKLRKMHPITESTSPDDGPLVKPGGSIADRMRALQDSGLNVASSSKRVARDLPTPASPKPPGRPLPIPTTPKHTSTSPQALSSPTVSTHPSPHSFVLPSTLAPSPTSSPSTSPQASKLDLSEFTQSFPSIDELDEDFGAIPPVPTGRSNISGKSSPNDNAPLRSFAFPPIDRPASTPLAPLGNSFSSRPPSPSNKSTVPFKGSNLSASTNNNYIVRVPIPRKNTATAEELRDYIRDHNVLVMDVRHREDFEKEHIRCNAVVCVEPVVLARGNVTAHSLEESMVAAPKHELGMFNNRDKFDLVVMYDESSTSFGHDSLLSILTQAIHEREFKKILKQMPMMLLGGLNAWKQEFGVEGLTFGREGSSDSQLTSPVIAPTPKLPPLPSTNGILQPMSPKAPNGFSSMSSASTSSSFAQANTNTRTQEIRSPPRQRAGTHDLGSSPSVNGHHPSLSLDQSSQHSRLPAESSSHRNAADVSKPLARRPAIARAPVSSSQPYPEPMQPMAMSPSLSMNGTSSPITYPQFPRRVSPHATGSGSPSSYIPSSYDIASPPLASISPTLSRRRSDYVDQSREVINTLAQQPQPSAVDYPNLNRTSHVLRPPPAVASGVHERQDLRLPAQPVPQNLPRIKNSEYPVSFWTDDQIGLSGLKNLGNTCYMNAPIQCLSASVPFARFFLEKSRWQQAINHMNPMGSKGKLTAAFASLVREMWSQEMTSLAANDLRRVIIGLNSQYQGYDQHDSQEFLSFLLDGIHEDLNRMIPVGSRIADRTPEEEAAFERLPAQVASDQEWQAWKRRNDSIIVDYFQGQFRSRLECMTCGQTSTTYNVFSSLSLPIPRDRSGKMALRRCLDALFSTETLEGDNAWDCPRCKTKRQARKQLSLARLPPILLIHLKRFEVNGRFSDKIDTFVDFPLKSLDLTSFMPLSLTNGIGSAISDPRTQQPPYRYDLYGVTNHYGNLSSGHYTAFISSRGGWKYCDDQSIRDAESKQVVNQKAYVLFYKRTKN